MAPSDVDTLVDMGFERERSQMAVRIGGGLQGAIDWLDKHQDKDIEEIKAANSAEQEEDDEEGAPALKPGEEARSLVCNECGKRFRSTAQAEFHASKSEHTDFSESTEEIAPLTEEEKAAKLQELREKLAEKRAGQSMKDKEEQKQNENIRRKATKEGQDIKDDLQRQQRIKEAQAKRREKQEDLEAKRRIQAKIAEDKEERKRKAEKEKAEREGRPVPSPLSDNVRTAEIPASTAAVPKKSSNTHAEARLRLQTPSGTLQKTFPAETTLFEVAHTINQENGLDTSSFTTTFPRKTFERADFGMTLKEAGWVPSAALIVK